MRGRWTKPTKGQQWEYGRVVTQQAPWRPTVPKDRPTRRRPWPEAYRNALASRAVARLPARRSAATRTAGRASRTPGRRRPLTGAAPLAPGKARSAGGFREPPGTPCTSCTRQSPQEEPRLAWRGKRARRSPRGHRGARRPTAARGAGCCRAARPSAASAASQSALGPAPRQRPTRAHSGCARAAWWSGNHPAGARSSPAPGASRSRRRRQARTRQRSPRTSAPPPHAAWPASRTDAQSLFGRRRRSAVAPCRSAVVPPDVPRQPTHCLLQR
mmetsp:Transcript_36673/g.88022  ORF Transcript_36673/g.88022 Transcript_36673/m.88022 type:complete len:272 (-) Transcript_36673:320-1135(-)